MHQGPYRSDLHQVHLLKQIRTLLVWLLVLLTLITLILGVSFLWSVSVLDALLNA